MIINFVSALVLLSGRPKSVSDTGILKWRPDYQLQYTDFKAEPRIGIPDDSKMFSDTGAVSSCNMEWQLKIDSGKYKISAYAVFYTERSWMLLKIPQWLRHEQGHFDITEIYAKQLERLANEEKIADVKDFVEFVISKQTEIRNDCIREQAKYDAWTRNTPGQDYYYKWIDDQLRELKNNK